MKLKKFIRQKSRLTYTLIIIIMLTLFYALLKKFMPIAEYQTKYLINVHNSEQQDKITLQTFTDLIKKNTHYLTQCYAVDFEILDIDDEILKSQGSKNKYVVDFACDLLYFTDEFYLKNDDIDLFKWYILQEDNGPRKAKGLGGFNDELKKTVPNFYEDRIISKYMPKDLGFCLDIAGKWMISGITVTNSSPIKTQNQCYLEFGVNDNYQKKHVTDFELRSKTDPNILIDPLPMDNKIINSYPAFIDKGAKVEGHRITLMTAKNQYYVGEQIRVIHIHEVSREDELVYIVGPKLIYGEYVDARPANRITKRGEDPLIPEIYNGIAPYSPSIDHNFEVTTYSFTSPGTHTIVWKVDNTGEGKNKINLVSNTLKIEVVPYKNNDFIISGIADMIAMNFVRENGYTKQSATVTKDTIVLESLEGSNKDLTENEFQQILKQRSGTLLGKPMTMEYFPKINSWYATFAYAPETKYYNKKYGRVVVISADGKKIKMEHQSIILPVSN